MKRKARYLVASILSLAKPFLAGIIVAGLSIADPGSVGAFFLRYLIVTQLLPSVCLFFLYFDEDTYRVFKPLVLLFSGVSIVLILSCVAPIAQNPQKYLLTTQNFSSLIRVSACIVLLCAADLVDFITVLASRKKRPDPSESEPSERPPERETTAGIEDRRTSIQDISSKEDNSSPDKLSERSDYASNA